MIWTTHSIWFDYMEFVIMSSSCFLMLQQVKLEKLACEFLLSPWNQIQIKHYCFSSTFYSVESLCCIVMACERIRYLVLQYRPLTDFLMQTVHRFGFVFVLFFYNYKCIFKIGNKSPNGISDYPKIRVTVTRDQPRRVLPSFG